MKPVMAGMPLEGWAGRRDVQKTRIEGKFVGARRVQCVASARTPRVPCYCNFVVLLNRTEFSQVSLFAMKPHAIPILVVATSIFTAKAGNLCKPGERVVESCAGKHKIASVCASPRLALDTGYLQYRFGTSKKIELLIPDTPQPISRYVHADHFSGTGGGSSYFGFQNGDFSYVFYSYWRKPDWQANPDNPSCDGPCDGNGMVVKRAGAIISKLVCEHGTEGSPLSNDEMDKLGITPSDDMIVE